MTFFDSVTGVPLFFAPVGRSTAAFLAESGAHGWPSFRKAEVLWRNVVQLDDGEIVSLTGTHLGHNLPDEAGDRYCINLVSIAGLPSPPPPPSPARLSSPPASAAINLVSIAGLP